MERHGGDERPNHFATTSSFPTDGGHHPYDDCQDHFHGDHHQHHQSDHRHPHNFNGEQNESTGHHLNSNSNHSLPLSGQKRNFSHSSGVDYGGFVKLYVVGVPRTATEQDISAVFGEYGHIIEVVLLKDKRTGLKQECCFVKYATIEQAEQAIGAFNSQYTFPGVGFPMKVKYADGERERLGSFGRHVHKLYVGCLNKQASKWEIEEIFSPFGVIEEIFIVRDEFKQNKGCAFVQFSCRDMAIAAIQALHGTYVMRGCDQPLIVRFADPKKPRIGDSRPTPYLNDPSNGHTLSNEMPQMKSLNSGCKTSAMTSNGTPVVSHASNSIAGIEHTIECDWSEHVSPDGDLYYYNCVTSESTWEKPEEYALYEQELDILEEQQQQQQESKLQVLSSPETEGIAKA
ncbi:RNA-binding protein ELAV/HU (RRM superfamily) [Handroanthus impetiginosus]|uniref:RNA-binding protein ELAV/HU (RRM superfamily) n=1 Tax=Handroanthus impetiginosus TaxID=429701 RepID=A0A2G9HDF9_9LAMI|nr:RNA-binding protein ELAV/HU (RRM superfamily) [Handroanthus impetiginosus]